MNDFYRIEADIRQLHARYVDAVWRQDVESFGACFANDAEWRIAGQVLRGRADISQFMAEAFKSYRRILMLFRTPLLDIANGEVTARTYVSEQSILKNGDAFGPIGIYYERFVLEDGAWRFGWRLFQTQYAGPPDMSGALFETEDFGPPPAMPPRDADTVRRSPHLDDDEIAAPR
jgi:ketosteroid isomerase-like protein